MPIPFLSIRNWLRTEEGQDLAEYALLLGLIAVVVMVAVAALGDGLLAYFGSAAAAVMGWSGGGGG
jgi:Flp pilus assembly pilin Flp